jgi:hypothetical protein
MLAASIAKKMIKIITILDHPHQNSGGIELQSRTTTPKEADRSRIPPAVLVAPNFVIVVISPKLHTAPNQCQKVERKDQEHEQAEDKPERQHY